MERPLLLTVTGRDAPGILAALSEVLARAGARLLDVEQVTVQGLLTLAFVVALAPEAEAPALKELLFATKSLGLSLDFAPARVEAEAQPRSRYALTLLGRPL